jgi:predicted phage terminase large subunit-like protein
MTDQHVLKSTDKPSIEYLSAREKFDSLPAKKRAEMVRAMSDEDAAKLQFDWEFLGRPKQLAPDHKKSKATSYCMCAYLRAQSLTDKKLKIENFPGCHHHDQLTTEDKVPTTIVIAYEPPDEDGWKPIQHLTPPVWIKEVPNPNDEVCEFRKSWATWVLLAGRGFGKTRVGAELAREMVETNQAKRIAVISPTASDARDVAVEGQSGLVNVCPPWARPLYESTKRRVTWPNGAQASLFSAEEPERLRGPQFDFAWCLIAGTLVETEFGKKPIETIKINDHVWTRKGLKKVYDVQMTGVKPIFDVFLSNGSMLSGTGEHKVWVEETGWLELQKLTPGAKLLAFEGVEKCESYTKESVTLQNSEAISQTETDSPYTGSFMKKSTENYQTDFRSIIKTEIFITTIYRISKLCLQVIIKKLTNLKAVLQSLLKRKENILTNTGLQQKGATLRANVAESNSTPTQTTSDGVQMSVGLKEEKETFLRRLKKLAKNVFVRSVRNLFLQKEGGHIVLKNVIQNDTNISITVLSVEPRLSQTINSQPAQQLAGTNSEFLSNHQTETFGKSCKNAIKQNGWQQEKEVWNLSIEDEHEFFASGVLAKNCDEIAGYDVNTQQMTWDMLQFTLRLGTNPRCVVTTTPKPTPLIQQLVKLARHPINKMIMTTGSTYENKTNLATPFMRQITQYEGTNLGRQEIYAELIDIEESGILKRSWFKQWPSKKAMPVFEFVIQSYDTAFTEKTENDPTGCVVFGVFRPTPDDPHCVMILDCWTEHLKYPELRIRAVEDYKATYGDQEAPVDMLLIEDKGSGIPLIQDLQRAGLPIRKYNPGRPDKAMRLHAVSHLVYNGRVYIPESKQVPGEFVTWAEDYLREVCAFPNSAHDEMVDCTTQALSVFRDQEWLSIDPVQKREDWEDEEEWGTEKVNPYAM